MNAIFSSFRTGGVKYLAIHKRDGNLHIVDDQGNNYGSWWNLKDFLKSKRESLGFCRLTHTLENHHGSDCPCD